VVTLSMDNTKQHSLWDPGGKLETEDAIPSGTDDNDIRRHRQRRR
jgi:hypothetical protein